MCVCVCVKKGVMAWYCRCSIANGSWPLWEEIFTQLLIFTCWCIFLAVEKFEAFCRVWISFFCSFIHHIPLSHMKNLPKIRPGLSIHVYTCRSNQEFSVAPTDNREFLILWFHTYSSSGEDPFAGRILYVKGLDLKRWCSLLGIIYQCRQEDEVFHESVKEILPSLTRKIGETSQLASIIRSHWRVSADSLCYIQK